jgi:hypothetical protein
MKHKMLAAISCIAVLSGCASSSSQYYEAVQKAAEANAVASQAKFEALSKIAAAGDGQAASAAVMALALTQTPTVQPVPQQSQALQWASILATPVTSLGMMWMQADSAKTMARYNADVDLARISADATTQQAMYGSFVDMGQIAGNVDYTPFVDGMVALGTTGMDNLTNLGTAGFDANTAIATVGLNSTTQLGVTGMDNLTNLGAAGFTSLVDLGNAGLDATVTMGTAGLDTASTLGLAGMNGITEVSLAGYENMLNMDAANNNLFSTVWSDYQSAIAEIMANVPQVSCTSTINADGSVSINCAP